MKHRIKRQEVKSAFGTCRKNLNTKCNAPDKPVVITFALQDEFIGKNLSLFETYRKNVQRKREEIFKLQNNKAKEQKKLPIIFHQKLRTLEAIGRTKNSSTIQSKLREIEMTEGQSYLFPQPKSQQSNRPGESHPQALTDPEVSLSTHPAPHAPPTE